MPLLVGELQAKTFLISESEKFRLTTSSINKNTINLQSERLPGVFPNLFHALNLAVAFVCP